MQLHYHHLGPAMLFESIATSALKASEGFKQWLAAVLGLSLLMSGVIVLQLFSHSLSQ